MSSSGPKTLRRCRRTPLRHHLFVTGRPRSSGPLNRSLEPSLTPALFQGDFNTTDVKRILASGNQRQGGNTFCLPPESLSPLRILVAVRAPGVRLLSEPSCLCFQQQVSLQARAPGRQPTRLFAQAPSRPLSRSLRSGTSQSRPSVVCWNALSDGSSQVRLPFSLVAFSAQETETEFAMVSYSYTTCLYCVLGVKLPGGRSTGSWFLLLVPWKQKNRRGASLGPYSIGQPIGIVSPYRLPTCSIMEKHVQSLLEIPLIANARSVTPWTALL